MKTGTARCYTWTWMFNSCSSLLPPLRLPSSPHPLPPPSTPSFSPPLLLLLVSLPHFSLPLCHDSIIVFDSCHVL